MSEIKVKCPNTQHDKLASVICLNKNCKEQRVSCIQCTKQGLHSSHCQDLEEIDQITKYIDQFQGFLRSEINGIDQILIQLKDLFDKFTVQLKWKVNKIQESKNKLNSSDINQQLQEMIEFEAIADQQSERISQYAKLFLNLSSELICELNQGITCQEVDECAVQKQYMSLVGDQTNNTKILLKSQQIIDKNLQFSISNLHSIQFQGTHPKADYEMQNTQKQNIIEEPQQQKSQKSQSQILDKYLAYSQYLSKQKIENTLKADQIKVSNEDTSKSKQFQETGSQIVTKGQNAANQMLQSFFYPRDVKAKLDNIFHIPANSSSIKQTSTNNTQGDEQNQGLQIQDVHISNQQNQQQSQQILNYVYQDLGNILGALVDVLETFQYFKNENEQNLRNVAINRLVFLCNLSSGIHFDCEITYKELKDVYCKEKINAKCIFDQFYEQFDIPAHQKIQECVNQYQQNLASMAVKRQIAPIEIVNNELNSSAIHKVFSNRTNFDDKLIQQIIQENKIQISKDDFKIYIKQRRENFKTLLSQNFPKNQYLTIFQN